MSTSNSNEITLIIADDHPIVRQGLRQAIASETDIKVLAEAGNGRVALDLIKQHGPQVAIMDIDMPIMNGFSLAEEIANQKLGVKIIFLTFHGEEDYLNRALELGANGFLLKDSVVGEIVACLRAVVSGQSYVSPTLTNYLLNRGRRLADTTGLELLSPAEREVLKLLAEYKTSKDIAAELHISAHTVNTHRSNIVLKLNLRGTHALMKFALDNKLRL